VLAAAVALFGAATTARADNGAATHLSFPVSGDQVFPTGTLCNFNEEDSFTGTVTFTLANGVFAEHDSLYVTHTNLDTQYTLTEHDVVNTVIPANGSTVIQAGVFFHLTDPSGKLVLVNAGKVVFDEATGELISFTPHTGFDQTGAQIVCTDLGGAPA
jgi:hypothetical protein